MELTNRQKEILSRVGLPTEYTQLTPGQKNDICSIEAMLCHLESTYGAQASYLSFVQAGPANPEMLTAKLGDAVVTVSRTWENDRYVYEDDYAAVKALAPYQAAIGGFFKEQYPETKVYARISQADGGAENVLAGVTASVFVFVCGETDRSRQEALAKAYGEWYAPQLGGRANDTRIYAVDAYAYGDIGEETYEDCLQEVERENRIRCRISLDGSVTVE